MPEIQINTSTYVSLGQSMESVQKALLEIKDNVNAALRKLTFLQSALTNYDNKTRAAIAKIPDQADRCGRTASWLFYTSERYIRAEELVKKSIGCEPAIFTAFALTNTDIRNAIKEYQPSIEDLYADVLKEREENAVDENTKKLYKKFKSKVKINDDDYDDTAHYNSTQNHINYDLEEDYENERGAGSTYYHEVGHLIDDQSDLFGYTSTGGKYDFTDCLENDINNWIQNRMKEKGYTDINDAYEDLSDWLWRDCDNKSGASDIVKGITEGKAGGRWGHDMDYYNDSSIAKEAFAHFFEAGMSSDPTKMKYLKELFPTAYAQYQKMIQDELNS